MPPPDRKRSVIITGASRGLGREVALRFGRAGDRIVVNFLSDKHAACTVVDKIVRSGGEAVSCRADVTSAAEVDAMIDDTVKRWGSADVLINNAGKTKDGIALRMTEDSWDEIIDTNLTGAFNTIRAAARVMVQQRQGHIVNVSSLAGVQGREGQANYSAAKAGLLGLTKAAAREFGAFNIKINAVFPGYLPTDMGARISDVFHDRILAENTLGRASDPREVAEFIYQLSLLENVSGQIFNLDSRIV
jgi:3-oxoacyl-[acyl-carrier protein] reductase